LLQALRLTDGLSSGFVIEARQEVLRGPSSGGCNSVEVAAWLCSIGSGVGPVAIRSHQRLESIWRLCAFPYHPDSKALAQREMRSVVTVGLSGTKVALRIISRNT
jgi:hypothetical protein